MYTIQQTHCRTLLLVSVVKTLTRGRKLGTDQAKVFHSVKQIHEHRHKSAHRKLQVYKKSTASFHHQVWNVEPVEASHWMLLHRWCYKQWRPRWGVRCIRFIHMITHQTYLWWDKALRKPLQKWPQSLELWRLISCIWPIVSRDSFHLRTIIQKL